MKPVGRAAAIILGTLLVLYLGDFVSARFGIPGHRQTWGSVEVQTLYAVRQKDNRIEYELGDVITQTCVHSLFPQMGYAPCWYLSEHATKRIDVGRLLFTGRQLTARETPVGLVTPFSVTATGYVPAANPEGTVTAFKRKMGTDYKYRLLGKEYTPQQLSAFLLQKISGTPNPSSGRRSRRP